MKTKLLSIFAGLLTASIFAISGTSYAAGSASFGVSSASVTTGSNTTIYISEDGSSVSAVTISYTYDTSKLQLVGNNCTGAFPSPIGSNTCYITPGNSPVSGSQDVMALTFKAIATGSASVTVTGSQIASNGSNIWNGNSASASITVTAPQISASPSKQTSGSSNKIVSSTNTGSKIQSSNNASANSVSTPSTTASSSTNKTSNNNTVKPVTISANSKTTPISVSDTATHTSATAAHFGLWGSFVAILLLIAAAYWFVFRKYEYTLAVTPKGAAPAPIKGKKTTTKKKSAKSSKIKKN